MIYVLDKSPKESAAAVADIHLTPAINSIAKVLSTAVQRATPEKITQVKNKSGVLEYWAYDQKLLPPLRDKRMEAWVDWAVAEYQRVWWLATYAWMLDKELYVRFQDLNVPLTRAYQVNSWLKAGFTMSFKKNNIKEWLFPVVIPGQPVFTGMSTSVDYYRNYYKDLRSKQRMRWTGKDIPEFLKSLAEPNPKLCGLCGSDADARMCDQAECPNKKMYNL